LLRGRTAADWVRIGPAKNLAVSELVPDAGAWHARELLVVPGPVAAVNAEFDEVDVRKTEA
jgi:hypothetical protein